MPIRTFALVLFATLISLTAPALALIQVGRGNDPVNDNNWPAGALDVANLKSRLGWWEGPPFGGGQHQFMYRGDAKALQEAIDLLAKVRAPRVRIVVHEGRHENPFLRDEKDPKADVHVDWTFTVWNPASFHHLYNDPRSSFSADDPSGRFRQGVEAPRLDVYVADEGKAGLDWAQVKVPAGARHVVVEDERATAAGYPRAAGNVVRGSAYDVTTSKPIAGAALVLARHKAPSQWEVIGTAKAGPDGRFELRNVESGPCRAVMTAEGYAPRMLGYFDFGGNTLREFEAYLSVTVVVSGTVVDTAGKPVAGATVRPDNTVGIDGRGYTLPDRAEVKTGADGRFVLAGLPRGHVNLFTYAPGYAPLDVLKPYVMPASDVTLRVTATGNVRGRVVGPDGRAATGANVSVTPAEGEAIGRWGGSQSISPDGTFAFDGVPPGRYSVSCDAAARINGAKDPTAKVVEVTAGATTEVELTKP